MYIKMTWNRLRTMAVAAAFMCVAPRVMMADLITNGGFETGTFSGWTVTNAASGSQVGVGNHVHSGAHNAYFGGTTIGSYDSITQTIATTPGDTYELDFWLSNLSPVGQCDFFVSWNGSVVAGSGQLNAAAYGYKLFTFNLIATGSSTDLEFSGYNYPNAFTLDDVSLTDVTPAAPVPEPASFFLFAFGAAWLVIFAARRTPGTASPVDWGRRRSE